MTLADQQLDLCFEGCPLGISARRIWEHMDLCQINPFASITDRSVRAPQGFVDVIDVSGPVPTLTGLTLGDILKGEDAGLPQASLTQLHSHIEAETARQWLTGLGQHLRRFGRQRFVRNRPAPFLPHDDASLL